MISKMRLFSGTLLRYVILSLAGLFMAWAMVAGMRWATSFQDSVTLPNGMVFERAFNWNRYGRWDLFGLDSRRRLARDVEFACFNDRYVSVQSYDRASIGLYDAETDSKVPVDDSVATDVGVLSKPSISCEGYYTGWVGPGLLIDGGRYPFLPPCVWRNIDNDTLRNRAWFERPCGPAERSQGG